MNIAAPFIKRPAATTLLTIAVALAGVVAFRLLPVASLPQVDFPTISVGAGLPGASPETMASSVATPLERQFGRIAAVTEMTSSSTLGVTNINLQFSLDRNIDAAARDVQAAINAARGYLPTNLPNNPSYRKVNPADSPIIILGLESKVLTRGQIYDAASSIVSQKLSQLAGVGQVGIFGSSLPGVRVELNPRALNRYGISLEQVRSVLSAANANTPKGTLSDTKRIWQLGANDQIFKASDYRPLILSYNKGSAVKLSDVAEVEDSVEDVHTMALHNAMPAILMMVFRQPGANVIATNDRVRAELPSLRASIPQSIDLKVSMDMTTTIRASVAHVEGSLAISVVLVILVVFIFLRNPTSTFIPSVAVPVSLLGTCAMMYLLNYSIDNLSLMALTISTGFVVDDAIVVIENVSRYLEQGMRPFEAALRGSREISFTVLTISISLIAVFIPLLMMGGLVGRLFHEFAVTLSIAITVSLLVSLTTTPMMCAHLLKTHQEHGWLYNQSERAFEWVVSLYGRTLLVALRHRAMTLALLLATIGLNIYLFASVPKGFFPQQDNGRLMGSIQADQDTSFQAMSSLLKRMLDIVKADPAVVSVEAFTGGNFGGTTNTARFFVLLRPWEERLVSADEIIARLRPKLARVPGATLFLQAQQDLRVGARFANAQYQFTMRGDTLDDLATYAPQMLTELQGIPIIADVNTDQQNGGLEEMVWYDRPTAARFGISSQLIDNTLYDVFGQRQVSTMYTPLNQYHVVMEAAPKYLNNPDFLKEIYVRSGAGQQVPLSAFATMGKRQAPLAINHQGIFPSVTISFNLQPGIALGPAVDAIESAARKIGLPDTVHTTFSGTAQAYQDSLGSEPWLVAAALASVYIVLGILYESYIHPITILSTLPSAGVGALLALMLCHTELTMIAIIGIILLIGIVKKNAIMMIDFAIAAERVEGKNSFDSIFEACMLRFRPIMMTTAASLLGALPLAIGTGIGSELRRPLGLTIIGGLLVSQALTLYTTPVVYLYLDGVQQWWQRRRSRSVADLPGAEELAGPVAPGS